MLDVDAGDKGILIPRVSLVDVTNAGDRVAIGFHYGESGNSGSPSGDCFLNGNGYGVVAVIEYNIQD